MNGINIPNSSTNTSRKHFDIYQTNPLGVSRKQFDKFVHHQGIISRKELLRRLDLQELLTPGFESFDEKTNK